MIILQKFFLQNVVRNTHQKEGEYLSEEKRNRPGGGAEEEGENSVFKKMYLQYERRIGNIAEKGIVPLSWLAGALLWPVIWLLRHCKKLRVAFHLHEITLRNQWR